MQRTNCKAGMLIKTAAANTFSLFTNPPSTSQCDSRCSQPQPCSDQHVWLRRRHSTTRGSCHLSYISRVSAPRSAEFSIEFSGVGNFSLHRYTTNRFLLKQRSPTPLPRQRFSGGCSGGFADDDDGSGGCAGGSGCSCGGCCAGGLAFCCGGCCIGGLRRSIEKSKTQSAQI